MGALHKARASCLTGEETMQPTPIKLNRFCLQHLPMHACVVCCPDTISHL